jgi:hypothetical protein
MQWIRSKSVPKRNFENSRTRYGRAVVLDEEVACTLVTLTLVALRATVAESDIRAGGGFPRVAGRAADPH